MRTKALLCSKEEGVERGLHLRARRVPIHCHGRAGALCHDWGQGHHSVRRSPHLPVQIHGGHDHLDKGRRLGSGEGLSHSHPGVHTRESHWGLVEGGAEGNGRAPLHVAAPAGLQETFCAAWSDPCGGIGCVSVASVRKIGPDHSLRHKPVGASSKISILVQSP